MSEEVVVKEVAKAVHTKEREIALYSSQPAAGFPAPGDDQIEKMLDINDLVVENPASTFYVRVSGDSMIGAGIFDNDVLVVDRSVIPRDGSIVVAAVYGELVVKYLSQKANSVALVSANEAYTPIEVTNNDDCFVWGAVIGSVRVFNH